MRKRKQSLNRSKRSKKQSKSGTTGTLNFAGANDNDAAVEQVLETGTNGNVVRAAQEGGVYDEDSSDSVEIVGV